MTAAANPDNDAPVIVLERVFQHINGRCTLNDLTLRVRPGDALLILGPNGAGKSLTLRLMLGLDQPSAGTVRVFGQDLAELDDRSLSQLRGRLGALLQGGSLLDELSVLENVLLPLRAKPHDPARMARAARLAVTQLQLDGMENLYPRALSLGQRRRTELARALIGQPEILLCDGLGDGLDQPAARDILEVLRVQREAKGLTVIATDNYLLDLIGPGDRVAVLDQGQLLFDGTRAEMEHCAMDNLEIRILLAGHP
jgi:ABC-type transporter Mla maintaining outer membrane lipid asymmetry ATPase subunit MlaF